MNTNDKIFLLTLGSALILILGISVQNTFEALRPSRGTVVVDVAKVTARFQKAGLEPFEAKHWKPLR